MSRSLTRVWPLLPALALLAVPAGAEIYTITLTNGSVIETAQQPQEASWDSGMVLFLTDVGNWVGVSKAEIESVRTETQRKGYGIRISDSTVAIGWAPNDMPIEEDAQGRGGADRVGQALDRIVDRQEQDRQYSIDQFVEPEQSEGMPSRFLGGGGGNADDPIEPDPGRFLTGGGSPPQQ